MREYLRDHVAEDMIYGVTDNSVIVGERQANRHTKRNCWTWFCWDPGQSVRCTGLSNKEEEPLFNYRAAILVQMDSERRKLVVVQRSNRIQDYNIGDLQEPVCCWGTVGLQLTIEYLMKSTWKIHVWPPAINPRIVQCRLMRRNTHRRGNISQLLVLAESKVSYSCVIKLKCTRRPSLFLDMWRWITRIQTCWR